jgi:hypothetical protein
LKLPWTLGDLTGVWPLIKVDLIKRMISNDYDN